MGKWKKNINIVDARKLADIFCKDFELELCNVYYVDVFHDKTDYAVYVDRPPTILMLNDTPNPIGILIHELTHHLQWSYPKKPKKNDTFHGYNYQLAKQKVILWCRRNISKKPNWNEPLLAYQSDEEMKKFEL